MDLWMKEKNVNEECQSSALVGRFFTTEPLGKELLGLSKLTRIFLGENLSLQSNYISKMTAQ